MINIVVAASLESSHISDTLIDVVRRRLRRDNYRSAKVQSGAFLGASYPPHRYQEMDHPPEQQAINAFSMMFGNIRRTVDKVDEMGESMKRMEIYMMLLVVLIYVIVGIFALLFICYAFKQYKARAARKRRPRTANVNSAAASNHTATVGVMLNKDGDSGNSTSKAIYSTAASSCQLGGRSRSPDPITPLTAQRHYHAQMRETRARPLSPDDNDRRGYSALKGGQQHTPLLRTFRQSPMPDKTTHRIP